MDKQDALLKSMSYCAKAERCEQELRKKWKLWEIEPDIQEELLEELQENNYLNEARYAEAYTRDKHRFNGWGEYRIRQELRLRGISHADIDRAWELLEEEFDSGEQLQKLLEKKYRSIKPNQPRRKTYEQMMRYGLYRGYPYEEVSEAVDRILEDED